MQIIVISSPGPAEDEIGILTALFLNGLETFHLRKPESSGLQTSQYLDGIPRRFRSRVVVHHHHRLAAVYGLKGVHFTEAERRARFERLDGIRTRCAEQSLSSSFHRMADIMAQGKVFDYVFLSPVFDSISKENYGAAFERPALQTFLKNSPVPVVALGGVNASRIGTVRSLGFSGAAVLGAVWGAEHPVDAFIRIKQAAESEAGD